MSYCPVELWKKAKEKGFTSYEQVMLGKKVSEKLKECNCRDKK